MQNIIESYVDAHREEILEQWKTLVNLEGKADELEAMDTVAEHLRRIFTEAGVSVPSIGPIPRHPRFSPV